MKAVQTIVLITGSALSAVAFFGSAATAGPPFSQSITACHMTKAAQIAALPAYPQCLETASGTPAECYGKTVRETKLIEPISHIGNPREPSEGQIDL